MEPLAPISIFEHSYKDHDDVAVAIWQTYNGHMAEQHEIVPIFDALQILDAKKLVKKKPAPSTEIVAVVRKGLPFRSFLILLKVINVSQKQLALVLGISDRTIARRKTEQQFNPSESDRLYRVARILAQAASTLGSIEKAREWATRPNRALGDETPLALLDTDIGARQVEDVLLRIQYGIYS